MTPRWFQLIPVLDVQSGRAVHAVAGLRAHYQPVQSRLHAGSNPLDLARAFRRTLGRDTLYLADLDAIAGAPPNLDLARQLCALGLHLWLDLGLTGPDSINPLLDLEATFVAGLETVAGPRELETMVHKAGASRVILSIDLDRGRPRIAQPAAWHVHSPLEIARIAIDHGLRRLLVLDLARVGLGGGLGTLDLIEQVREIDPEIELALGGGIHSIDQVIEARARGASAVLVASALHDGRIGPDQIARLNRSSLTPP
jgi:phosphoribosylformimino-5-aminoimidazole carboxamide ribotide isomerase